MEENVSKVPDTKIIIRLLAIICVLLVVTILLQLVSIKHSHDNSYRLSHISKNTGDTSNAMEKIVRDGVIMDD